MRRVKIKNGNKIICAAFWLFFHSLTLCAAVGVSAINSLSAATTLNWTLNFRQLPLLDFALSLFFSLLLRCRHFLFGRAEQISLWTLYSSLYNCLLLCTKSSMLHSHTGIIPGIVAWCNFGLAVGETPDQHNYTLAKLMTKF